MWELFFKEIYGFKYKYLEKLILKNFEIKVYMIG